MCRASKKNSRKKLDWYHITSRKSNVVPAESKVACVIDCGKRVKKGISYKFQQEIWVFALYWPKSWKPCKFLSFQTKLDVPIVIFAGVRNNFGHVTGQQTVTSAKNASLQQNLGRRGWEVEKILSPPLSEVEREDRTCHPSPSHYKKITIFVDFTPNIAKNTNPKNFDYNRLIGWKFSINRLCEKIIDSDHYKSVCNYIWWLFK